MPLFLRIFTMLSGSIALTLSDTTEASAWSELKATSTVPSLVVSQVN